MPQQELIPFSAIAGNTLAKKSILCLLVNPHLRCLMVSGGAGTGKTALIRSIATLDDRIPVVNVPIGSTEDRMFGSVDLENAISTGGIRIDRGLFSEASGGVICIDDISLMDIRLALEATNTAIKGSIDIEREGISTRYAADVSLIATTSGSVRSLDGHLTDRFDMCVMMQRPDGEEYIESLKTILRLENGDRLLEKELEERDEETLAHLERARALLPQVRILKRHRDAIARLCVKYGVKGYRGPVSCAQTAVALAALEDRRKTSDDDIIEAATLCLNHRRTVFETDKKPEIQEQPRGWSAYDMIRFVHDDRRKNINTSIVDKINERTPDVETDDEDEDEYGGERLGKDAEKSIETKVGRRFDVIDIMESADSLGREDNKRIKRFVESPTGKHSGSRIPEKETSDIAIDATLRAAAPHQIERGSRNGTVRIEKQDIREKIRTKHVEQTFYFMVDFSGSLIIRNRISTVKAAVLSMLRIHYQKRDRVGLMTFNEERMEEVMAPTRAVSEISKAVEKIEIGRGTPLSQALMACWSFVQNHTRKRPEEFIHIVLFTDGKATRSLDPERDPCEEALDIARRLKAENVDWIVVDTGLGTTKSDMPEKLADVLGGRYFLLDDLRSDKTVSKVWSSNTADSVAPSSLPLWERDRSRGYR